MPSMEFFIYCRDNPGTGRLRDELAEAHQSFMDGYAEAMIARGPTLTPDRETATGSMHMVDLPDAEAARVFAFEEPNYRAGVYGEVLVRRWRNALGRTMWDFDGDPAANRRFLVIGHGRPGVGATRDLLLGAHRRYLADHGDCFIARGPLLSDDGTEWIGSAWLVELRDRAAVDALRAGEPFTRAGLYVDVEVHDWQFGGRSR
jgi:uncharacterized protein YciI